MLKNSKGRPLTLQPQKSEMFKPRLISGSVFMREMNITSPSLIYLPKPFGESGTHYKAESHGGTMLHLIKPASVCALRFQHICSNALSRLSAPLYSVGKQKYGTSEPECSSSFVHQATHSVISRIYFLYKIYSQSDPRNTEENSLLHLFIGKPK